MNQSLHVDAGFSLNDTPRWALIVGVMPFVETLVGQWLPIRLVRRWSNRTWWWAGAVSAIWFTCLHGYVDRGALTIFLGAVVLAGIS